MTSIYTSQSGEWRLGGFELLSSMKEDNALIYVSLQLARSTLASV